MTPKNMVSFGEVFEFLSKSKYKAGDASKSGEFPFFVSSQDTIKRTDEAIYDADALVFGTGGSASIHHVRGAFSASTDCVVATTKINAEFLPRAVYYYLKSNIHLVESGFRGAGLKHISKGYLKELKIPKISLEEQKRIVEILDKADAVRRKRQLAIEKSEKFLRSVFLDMFGDPVTNPKGWEKKCLSEIGDVVTGNTPSRKKPEYYGHAIEWIKSDNINTPGHFLTQANEYLSEEGKKIGRVAPFGSILVTCIAGTPECIGNVAMTDRDVAFNQQINALIPNSNVNNYFLYAQFLFGKKLVQMTSTEGMKGLVSKSRFSSIKFIVPPIDVQRRFGELFIKYNNTIKKIKTQEKKTENMFSSLTHLAFRGELTNQAADELLEAAAG